MRHPRHKALVDKAVAACLAAIEAYNKPTFAHREETFAILMINAWELLLKARILKDNGSKLSSIYEYGPGKTKSGGPSRRLVIRRAASGNPRTIGLASALKIMRNLPKAKLPDVVADNIEGLQEIRDSAVHFVVTDRAFAGKVWEFGTAALRNFMSAAREWFDCDLSKHSIFLMPLAFVQPSDLAAVATGRQKEVQNLEAFLDTLDKRNASIGADKPYVATLRLDMKLVGSRHAAGAAAIRLTTDPSAPVVRLEADDLRDRYPMTYEKLTKQLRARYTDFLSNQKFYTLKEKFEGDPRYAMQRKLDPDNPKTVKMWTYSPAILEAFDAHYTKRGKDASVAAVAAA